MVEFSSNIVPLFFPFVLLSVLFLLHLVLANVLRKSIVQTFFISYLATSILFVGSWLLFVENGTPFYSMHFTLFVANYLIFFCFSYVYINVLNIGSSSIRIFVLDLIQKSGGKLSTNDLLELYNSRILLFSRLERLIKSKQLVDADQIIRLGSRKLQILPALFLLFWRRIMLGPRIEIGSMARSAFVSLSFISYLLVITSIPSLLEAGAYTLAIFIVLRFGLQRIRPETRESAKTVIALGFYSLLLALIITFIRTGMGYLELPPYLEGNLKVIPRWSFGTLYAAPYDKSEIRLVVLTLVTSFISSSLLLFQTWAGLRHVGFFKKGLHPATPSLLLAFALVATILPPFSMEPSHWTTWIAPAIGILEGKWPFLHTQLMYGFLSPASIGGLIRIFGLSPMLLVGWVTGVTLVSSFLLFTLVRKITRSPWLGFFVTVVLLAFYDDLARSIQTPNHGTHRWVIQYLFAQLLLFHSLFSIVPRPYFVGSFFALACLWEPGSGVFLAFSFLLVHIFRAWKLGSWHHLKPVLASTLVGLGLLLMVFSYGDMPFHETIENVKSGMRIHSLFLTGFGSRIQDFCHADLIFAILSGIVIALVSRHLFRRHVHLSGQLLFLIFSLVSAIPLISYSLVSSTPELRFHLVWVMSPALALIVRLFYRLINSPQKYVFVAGAVLLLVPNVKDITSIAVQKFNRNVVQKYEEDRERYYRICAETPQYCNAEQKPTLFGHVRFSASQFVPNLQFGNIIELSNPFFIILSEACRVGLPIVTPVDAWIFAYASCRIPHKYSSYLMAATQEARETLFDSFAENPIVFVGKGYGVFQPQMQNDDIRLLKDRGFIESEDCNNISIMTNPKLIHDQTNICESMKHSGRNGIRASLVAYARPTLEKEGSDIKL